METQHTTYRQIMSVLRLFIPKYSVWKHNTEQNQYKESLGRECIELQHTAYRQIRSVFVFPSIQNTHFGSVNPILHSLFESVWKHNTQHIAKLGLRVA